MHAGDGDQKATHVSPEDNRENLSVSTLLGVLHAENISIDSAGTKDTTHHLDGAYHFQ